jgi:hypothetical protein
MIDKHQKFIEEKHMFELKTIMSLIKFWPSCVSIQIACYILFWI